MSAWSNGFSNDDVAVDATDNDTFDSLAEQIDDSADDAQEPAERLPAEAGADTERSEKKAKTVSRRRGTAALTRAQVQRVLDLRDELNGADSALVKLLAHVSKSDQSADELTIALLTQSAGADDVLAEVGQLLEVAGSPFRLGAQLAGMERPVRNRVHAVISEITDDSTPLPRDEINAAEHISVLISGLTDDQRSLIARAQEIRG